MLIMMKIINLKQFKIIYISYNCLTLVYNDGYISIKFFFVTDLQ